MGQCSTLPSEGRQSRRGGRDEESSYRDSRTRKSLQVQTPNRRASQPADYSSQQQGRGPNDRVDSTEPMDTREDIPLPPDIATRTRCYKLNLDSDLHPHHSVFLGPFIDVAPPMTCSLSSDSAESNTPLQVAINTAKIFRGITVGSDGTILSQNARATRSNRGSNKNKVGEKSRQATKIDKAKDLVEETILTGKAPDSNEPANMQSIVVMGEYDDMKYLVRDGAKKLREASELADDSLLSINRGRDENASNNIIAKISSPRKRGSMSSLRNSGMHTPNKSRQFSQSGIPPKLKSHPRDRLGVSRKDASLARRENRENGANGSNADRAGAADTRSGRQNDGDWGKTLPVSFSRGFQNIWNCGATGERSDDRMHSPTQQVAGPRDGKAPMSDSSGMHQNQAKVTTQSQHKTVYEGRDSQQYGTRESGVTTRAN
mmetsp:Transcript_18869/g.52697  ORF Transcript_18869/g.52697 Transcript_18869/m.52697 type:complete len:431 (+) Transcript_18869:244-1536(+)|eukprot:CAMPEP_0172368242 /NCGR_PEP_ID=MMETSP1060-20121228/25922_1 /TAXON_ID=37318 /ORGANISM="Pseudo-nitzschia pungens, Strain cf. cingulata" /LENGTH=430 /DNA_ID=CAMNT_0013092757 /DNA_START=195 /DNA_END=1487 /DNA_ORIENTATION=+